MLTTKQLSDLLEELKRLDESGTGWVAAGSVEKAFQFANILTSSQQDEALLLLIVDAKRGQAGYERLQEEVEIKQKQPQDRNGKSCISQQDLVFKIVTELRSLFNKFDIGALSITQFREELSKLGLQETTALKELFRHTYEMTFHQFVQALTRVDEKELSSIDNGSTTMKRRPKGLFDEGRDDDMSMKRNIHSVGIYNKESKGFYPHRHPDPENRDANMLSGDGIQRKGKEIYQTTNQYSNSPLRKGKEPETSAGYETRDKGLLRHQVHALIRTLDSGDMDPKTFTRRLNELGITTSSHVMKMLDRQRTGNTIPFKDWVKAFEPFFEEGTFPDEDQKMEAVSKIDSKSAGISDGHSRLIRGSTHRPLNTPTEDFFFAPPPPEANRAITRKIFEKPTQRNTMAVLVPELIESEDISASAAAAVNTGKGLRGRVLSTQTSKPDFLCWSDQDYIKPPPQKSTPLRAHVSMNIVANKPPPYAREGDLIPKQSLSGITRSPEKRTGANRIPFGTEADYAATFANGIVPPTRPAFG